MLSIALALAAIQTAPTESTLPPEPAPQPMTIEIVRDPINDRLRAIARLRANGERIELRCRARDLGDVSVQYHSRRWIARGNFLSGQQPVTYRFDDHPPVRGLWHVNERMAGFDNRSRVIAFIRGLLDARRLVLRTRDIENHTFDAIFPIGETRPAIVELLHTCGSRRLNSELIGEQ